jgi:hypothetical protein
MPSSGMLQHVALVRTEVLEELTTSVIKVTRIIELSTTLAVNSNRRTQRVSVVSYANVPISPIFVALMMEAQSSSETSVVRRVTRLHISEDCILHRHRRENLKSYIILTGLAM